MTRKKQQESYVYEDRDDESINCCQLDAHKDLIRRRKASKYEHSEINLFAKRSCTDVYCLFIFIAALIGWISVGVYVFTTGGPQRVFAPVDSNNRRCGYDNGVENKPYLLVFDITRCLPPRQNFFLCNSPQVCVSECPKTNFSAQHYLERRASLWSIKEKLICVPEFNKNLQINSYGDVKSAIDRGYCAEWYMQSEPVLRRCLPQQLTASNPSSYAKVSLPDGVDTELNGITPKLIRMARNEIDKVNGFFDQVVKDLMKLWPEIVGFMCVGMIMSFVLILIMKWISGILVWASIIILIALLSYLSYFSWMQYTKVKDQEKVLESSKTVLFADLRIDAIRLNNDFSKHEFSWLALFIVSILSLIIILLVLLFLRSRIHMAIKLIKEGSKAVSYAWTSLIFPLFPWTLQLAVFAQSAFIFCYLIGEKIPIYRVTGLNGSDCSCSNGYKDGAICDVETFRTKCSGLYGAPCTTAQCTFSDNEAKNYAIYLHLFNLFMFLWCEYFLAGFTHISLAMTYATYYWTKATHNMPFCIVGTSIAKVIQYHLGTVSLGSFLLALLNWVRVLVDMFYRYINRNDSAVLNCLRCCCGWILSWLQKILQILTNNAYIMCAMKGTNYCSSAKRAFDLIIRNVLRALILNKIAAFLFFLIKLLITVVTGALAYWYFSKPIPDLRDPKDGTIDFEYYFIPIILVCIATFLIASLFFGVYTSAVDTIFLCALEDLDQNDGTPHKPFAMSKSLRKIFHVQNQRTS